MRFFHYAAGASDPGCCSWPRLWSGLVRWAASLSSGRGRACRTSARARARVRPVGPDARENWSGLAAISGARSLPLSDPCGLPAAAPGSRRAVVAAGLGSRLLLVAAPVGRAVGLRRYRQGGLACRQALVQGRRPVGPEGQEELDSSLPEFYGPSNPVLRSIQILSSSNNLCRRKRWFGCL